MLRICRTVCADKPKIVTQNLETKVPKYNKHTGGYCDYGVSCVYFGYTSGNVAVEIRSKTVDYEYFRVLKPNVKDINQNL